MPPKRRRRFQGLYYHSSPPKVLPMNDQSANQNGRRRRDVDDFSIKLSTIRIWMHEKEIGKLARILWAGQGNRLRQQASTNPRVKRFLAAVPYVMNAIKEVHQAVIENNLETVQAKLEPPVPPALVTGKDANGLNVIHKAAGLGHTKILEYLISIWPEGANEVDITGKTSLHWAASAKNNMRCYTLLTESGCDEEAVDYKSKTPSYYRHKPNEIERAFLVYVPDAPRVSPDVLTDWEALNDDTNSDKKSDTKASLVNSINGRTTIDDSTNDENFSDLNDGVSAIDENELPKPEPESTDADDFHGNNDDSDGNVHKTAPVTPAVYESHQFEVGSTENQEKTANEISKIYDASEKSEQDARIASAADDDSNSPNDIEANKAEKDEVEDVDMGNESGVELGERAHEEENGKENEKADKDLNMNGDFDKANESNDENQSEENENDNILNAPHENIIEATKNSFNKSKQEEEREVREQEDEEKEDEEKEDEEGDEQKEKPENSGAETETDGMQESKEKLEVSFEKYDENMVETLDIAEDETADNYDDTKEEGDKEKTETGNIMVNKDNVRENTEDIEKNLFEAEKNKAMEQDGRRVEDSFAINDLKNMKGEQEKENLVAKGNDTDSNKSSDKDVKIIKTKADNDKSSDESVDEEDEDVVVPGEDKDTHNFNTPETAETLESETLENQSEDDALSNDKLDENHNTGSRTSSLAIEGFVQGESEDNTVQSQSAALYDEEPRIQDIIASGDMEQLAQIVLNGDGNKLLDMQSSETDIQAFLNNVPNYMSKIRRVHEAAREGSLLSLQQALDRRKFAIAKDEISPNGATPLHVAVLFGHSDIVRYLAARFPETTTITDNDGRTALHYAAVIKDNGHFYNLLIQLGANPKAKDKLGYAAEYYFEAENSDDILTYRQLLSNFGAEDLEAELLSDQGEAESHSFQSNPIFKTEQGKYLASTLAEPLIEALTEIANKRPDDPISYLTGYLQSFMRARSSQTGGPSSSSKTSSTALANPSNFGANRMNGNLRNAGVTSNDEIEVDDSEEVTVTQSEDRDEHGQSMLHFACARSHRRGGLMHLIEESNIDITYRDELYRTARDVSLQANQPANAKEIDRYVLSQAVVGDLKPFEHFALAGYDHIIDIVDDNDKGIIDVVVDRGYEELADFLRNLRPLEELREELHQMIRDNNVERIKEIVSSSDGKWLLNAKNYFGRTALHIAVLKELEEVVEYFVELHPEIIKIGDNLERTPLHYAMGTNAIESLSRILINKGAKRTTKDLKGRQPSYYFMNKADILRLEEEEDENR